LEQGDEIPWRQRIKNGEPYEGSPFVIYLDFSAKIPELLF